jgi:hypothetical protein
VQISTGRARINQTRACGAYATQQEKEVVKDDIEYDLTTPMSSHKKCSPKRWVDEGQTRGITGSENFTRYEKKTENYLGLVSSHAVCYPYKKIILG